MLHLSVIRQYYDLGFSSVVSLVEDLEQQIEALTLASQSPNHLQHLEQRVRSLLWLFTTSVPVPAQTKSLAKSSSLAGNVDAYVKDKMSANNIPGLSLAVVRDGKLIVANDYRMANLELSVPATAKTNYPIMSITKTFTAMATMLLVEDGKISLDNPISKHLSEFTREMETHHDPQSAKPHFRHSQLHANRRQTALRGRQGNLRFGTGFLNRGELFAA